MKKMILMLVFIVFTITAQADEVTLTGVITDSLDKNDEICGTTAVELGKIRFTPINGFSGDCKFIYEIEDDEGLTDTATVTVEVEEAPPPAISEPTISMADQIVDDNAEAIPTDLSAPTVTDVEAGAVYEIVGDPTSGMLTINEDTGVATWLGNLGGGGTDFSITFKVTNPDGGTDSITFNLHVNNNA